MQNGALFANVNVQSIFGATGKDSEHGIRGGGYKTRKMEKGLTILNNPECISPPLGAEYGDISKGKSGGVGGGRQQQ